MKFEYKIKTYTNDQAGLDILNTDGSVGWEIVVVMESTANDHKVLLKRRYE